MVAQTNSPPGEKEVRPITQAEGDLSSVNRPMLAATAAASYSPLAMADALADPTVTEGPLFYLPNYTVYLPIRIRRQVVRTTVQGNNNKLWEATNAYLKSRKPGIIYCLGKDEQRPCGLDLAGREPYLPWGHQVDGSSDDGNWIRIRGRKPKPGFDYQSTMMAAFPESPDRPKTNINSLANMIKQQQQLTAIIPSDPMRFAMSPNTNPPAPSAPDAALLRSSGSSTAVEAVTSVAQTATDLAAGATALASGTAAGWMIGNVVGSSMTKSALGDLPIVGDAVASVGGQVGAATGAAFGAPIAGAALNAPQSVVGALCARRNTPPPSPGGATPIESAESSFTKYSNTCKTNSC